MKKSLFIFYKIGVLCVLIQLIACNKHDAISTIFNQSETKELLKSYLLQQQFDINSSKSFVDTLINKTNWEGIEQNAISNNVALFFVPLNYKNRTIGIAFLFNKNIQKVYYSHIVEIKQNSNSKIPTIDLMKQFYNYQIKSFTGSISAYSLSNQLLWEYGYVNGVANYEKRITSLNKNGSTKNDATIISNSNTANFGPNDICIDWYLVTWFRDGTSIWVYMGRTCTDGTTECNKTIGISVDSTKIISNCGNIGGGGDGKRPPDDNSIINNITDPCLRQLISNLQNANKLTNAIGGILQSVFGVSNKVNITFNQDDNLKNINGIELNGQSYPNGSSNFIVDLNSTSLNVFSQERKTLTIMHEILHSYLSYEFNKGNTLNLPNQHTVILSKYIDYMASSLEDIFPAMKSHHNVTLALCFDNLKTSIGNNILIGEILPIDFELTLITHGLNVNTWQNIANLAKFKDKKDSPFASSEPCANSNFI